MYDILGKIEKDQLIVHNVYQANNLNEFNFDIYIEVNEQEKLHKVDGNQR